MTTTTKTELHLHAVEVDTRIAALHVAWGRAQSRVASMEDTLHYAANHRRGYGRDSRWTHRVDGSTEYATLQDAINTLQAKGDVRMLSYGKTGNEMLDEYRERIEDANKAQEAYYEAELDYEGWSRFFMVQGGHIHSSMNCSTCNKRGKLTSFGWLPELSGLTEAEAVKAHGPVLCTICYPTAPVEWTEGQLNANGEYVPATAYCAGSNTMDIEGERNPRLKYVRCAHCQTVQTVTGKGIRKHKAPKA